MSALHFDFNEAITLVFSIAFDVKRGKLNLKNTRRKKVRRYDFQAFYAHKLDWSILLDLPDTKAALLIKK